jgi:hypothetical protein
MQWVSRLTHALDTNRFRLYQQVIAPLGQHGQSRPHHEVLLRLLDEKGRMKLPVDFLKIDGNFIRTMVEGSLTRAMADAINRAAHVMAIETVADGAESASILALLRELGVDHAQGSCRCQRRTRPYLAPMGTDAIRHTARDLSPSARTVTSQAFSPVASNKPPHGSAAGMACSRQRAVRVAEGGKIAERNFSLRSALYSCQKEKTPLIRMTPTMATPSHAMPWPASKYSASNASAAPPTK